MHELLLPHNHGKNQQKKYLKEFIDQTETFNTVADIFKLLSDSSRLHIFWLLCHCEECVINISSLVNMSAPAVSHHLRQLKAYGLIISRRSGKEVYYKCADTEEARQLHKVIEKIMEISCPKISENTSENAAIIHEIHEYILQNTEKKITIEDLSHKYHINPTTLKTVFKDVYGNSIAAHMKQHRMEKAASLLSETTDTVAQIAAKVGYKSQSKFSQSFKDTYKMLPLEYRKNILSK